MKLGEHPQIDIAPNKQNSTTTDCKLVYLYLSKMIICTTPKLQHPLAMGVHCASFHFYMNQNCVVVVAAHHHHHIDGREGRKQRIYADLAASIRTATTR